MGILKQGSDVIMFDFTGATAEGNIRHSWLEHILERERQFRDGHALAFMDGDCLRMETQHHATQMQAQGTVDLGCW